MSAGCESMARAVPSKMSPDLCMVSHSKFFEITAANAASKGYHVVSHHSAIFPLAQRIDEQAKAFAKRWMLALKTYSERAWTIPWPRAHASAICAAVVNDCDT